MHRPGTVAAYGSSSFSFLRDLYTDSIVAGSTYTPTNNITVLGRFLPPTCFQIYFVFSVVAILTVVRWNLNAIFICIFLVANDVEHLYMHLLAILSADLKSVCLVQLAIHWLDYLLLYY